MQAMALPPSLVEESVEPSFGELLVIPHEIEPADAGRMGSSTVASRASIVKSFIFNFPSAEPPLD